MGVYKSAFNEYIRGCKWIQCLILGFLVVSSCFFITAYLNVLGSALGGMESNTISMQNSTNLSRVLEYSISTDGTVTGVLEGDVPFTTTLGDVVLVTKLPDSDYCLYDEPTLIVEPTGYFTNNLLLVSKIYFLIVALVVVLVLLSTKYGKQFIVLGGIPSRVTVGTIIALLLFCVISTYILI